MANGSPVAMMLQKENLKDHATENLFLEVLKRYPDCPELPPLPAGASTWDDKDFEVFIESMGLIIPQKTGPEGGEEVSKHAAGETQTESSQIKNIGTASACLVIPSTIYMEDRAPEGLKLEAVLTKFDRCRAAALQSICSVNLRLLSEDYGVGILLSDLSFVIEALTPPDLISAASVESEIDLPKLPLVPSRQRLMDSNGGVACSAVFGQLLADLDTKRLSGNHAAYNRLKAPCDRVFGRAVPNVATLAVRKELAEKLDSPNPIRGKLFKPHEYVKGRYVIAPSDCDTYDTLYHPKAPSVCEHACLSTGKKFCCNMTTAFFARFISPLPPGLDLVAHVFIEASDDLGTRVLFVFEEEGRGGACALSAFAVYGGPAPGALFQEEVQATTAKSARLLAKLASEGSWTSPNAACDLSALS